MSFSPLGNSGLLQEKHPSSRLDLLLREIGESVRSSVLEAVLGVLENDTRGSPCCSAILKDVDLIDLGQ